MGSELMACWTQETTRRRSIPGQLGQCYRILTQVRSLQKSGIQSGIGGLFSGELALLGDQIRPEIQGNTGGQGGRKSHSYAASASPERTGKDGTRHGVVVAL